MATQNNGPYVDEIFVLDFEKAYSEQLLKKLTGRPERPLRAHQAVNSPGIYILLQGGVEVYVGKADYDLAGRLSRHADNISARHNISLDEMSCRYIYFLEHGLVKLGEPLLIKHYNKKGRAKWNSRGFGSNDPGRKRDKGKTSWFDEKYPIRHDYIVEVPAGSFSALELLQALRKSLPFTLRFEEKDPQALAELGQGGYFQFNDLRRATVTEWLAMACAHLPSGWQLTALPGRILLYREHDDRYPGQILSRW
ncbi:Eco29kI family restriction endonuclease [Archangium sp. Cb G35]|uniref:Eco29kI family restriction endonuclease n=1 Tax=Archangium sp. Cb G35 TaxID=1920190 RepID=UPI0009FA4333|nr:Eco29kI family restriction endonuclease [Archangium sp. Cb G35]